MFLLQLVRCAVNLYSSFNFNMTSFFFCSNITNLLQDTRANAEKAKWELDGMTMRNRPLRVRFATHGAALSVKNLSPQVRSH